MSLYSAMRSGVSGMSAQSARIAAISDNISNSGTVGYKRSDVDFSSLVASRATESEYVAGGIRSNVHHEISRSGPIQGTSNSTDLAIKGRGFFVVGAQSVPAAGASQDFALTRAGSFKPDDNGYLRNSAGYYLQGWKLGADGNLPMVSRDSLNNLETVKVGGLTYRGSATSNIQFGANLPAQATGGNFTSLVSFYDGLGAPQEMTLTWTPDGGVANRWNLAITTPPGYAVAPIAINNIDFNDTGINAGLPVTPIGNLTLTKGADTVSVNFDGVRQFNGDYVPVVTKDGAKAGQVSSVEVDDAGKVWAIYDNGARQALYQVPVADVMNPDGLTPQEGNVFTVSVKSGGLFLRDAGTGSVGGVAGAALEQSNVDIAQELVSLIETQRAYSSNAKIVQTADEMMEETTRLKR